MIPERIELKVGSQIDNYTITKQLGEGGFGSVYLINDRKSASKFALKLLRLWEIDPVGRDNILARFELEFQTGQIPCENLVKNYNFGYVNGNPYIIMEYCPNGDLRGRFEKNMVTHEMIPKLGLDVLKGLASLHSYGKIHRDLKPENVLFDSVNNARLADFGIVGHANLKVRLTKVDWKGKPQQVWGTYIYMPPEQAQPKSAHVTILPTVDIFAFGVMMFELYTGQFPFGSLRTESDLGAYVMNAARGIFPPIQSLNPRVPDSWAAVISECLMPDYRSRPQNITSILARLNNEVLDPNSKNTGGVPSERLKLVIMQGEEHKKEYDLNRYLNGERFGLLTIGRNDIGINNNINIKDDICRYISRKHCTIERINQPPYWIIKDGQWQSDIKHWIPSTNGTYVNSQMVDSFKGFPIIPGDIITIGDTTLKVVNI